MLLIAFLGPPCSGKTTLAAELARRRGLPHLSMDATRQRLLPDAAHTRADRQVAYRGMHFAAELLLKAGASVILDAPYDHPEDRAELERIGGEHLRVVECRVPAGEAVRRLYGRGWPDPSRPDLTDEKVTRLVSQYPYRGTGLTIHSGGVPVEECLLKIEGWLGT